MQNYLISMQIRSLLCGVLTSYLKASALIFSMSIHEVMASF
jgi:hypothetical protein